VYLIEDEGTDKNTMFMLKGQEFTFDVELSTMPCGFNAAMYFVGMTENEGGAEKGTNYCDAQAVDGVFCSEMDLMESNTRAQQYTTHACVDTCGSFSDAPECKGASGSKSAVCDQNGCGLNPFRYGPGTTYDAEFNNGNWHGPDKSYALDSSLPFTVVTQFHADNQGSGDLVEIQRFYLQNGNRIELPTLYVLPPTDGSHMEGLEKPSITQGYCTDIYDRWNGGNQGGLAPLSQMGKNMEKGMVLAMSAWYSQESYTNGKPTGGVTQTGMSWLDGVNQWGKYIKAGPCDTSTTQDAGPYHATFSDIRIGDIGTTVPDHPSPAPSPPGPSPPAPSPSGPTPAPPTPPSPPAPPSGCPGGTLQACITLCPSDPPVVYAACVKSCAARCV